MPRLAPKELKLEAKEREHLEKLINRHTTHIPQVVEEEH